MPKLSIIILTFNSERFIKSCLDAVFNQGDQDFEVILVDNGSKDNTLSLIKENYSDVKLIENKENLGAAKARNRGIEIAGGKWILTLDCDVTLLPNFIGKMMDFAKRSNEAVGIFQPKILKNDNKTIYSCGIHLSKLRKFYDIGQDKPDDGRFDEVKYIFGACSAAALYKRQMLEDIKEKTGYFDERFFFLVEDLDLAWRAQKKGWKGLFYPHAACYHSGNSSGCDKKFRQYMCFRNRHLSILKNDNIDLPRKIVIALLYDLPRLLYLMLTNNYMRGESVSFSLLKEKD